MAEKKWNMASYPDMHRLEQKVNEDFDAVTQLIVNNMLYIGEKCLTVARDKKRAGTWKDQTGNLRSSIGSVVQLNGKPVTELPIEVFEGKDGKPGTQGPKEAKKLMKSLQGIHASGVELIVVAGMEYAEYVENIHHKDVLTSAKMEGERLAKYLLGDMFSKTKGS